jgi:nucleotide-binding universal stress UspA family protein
MYARILVAIDASPNAEHALQHATGLAKGLSAALRIVHVVDLGWIALGPELAIDVDSVSKARHAAGEKLLAAAQARVRESGLDAEIKLVETAIPTQHIAAAIADEAAAWPADLLVVGSHGLRGVTRLLLGSVAEGVARRSSVPVLLVPLH